MKAILIAALMLASTSVPQFDTADSNAVALQAYCSEDMDGDLGLASAIDLNGNVVEFEDCNTAFKLGVIGPY